MWRIPLGLGSMVVLAACKRDAPSPLSAPDAGALTVSAKTTGDDAGPAERVLVPPSDPTLRVVAESIERSVRGTVSADGRTILAVGPVLYDARADGTLRRLVEPKILASVFPSEEPLGGYAATIGAPTTMAGSVSSSFAAVYDGKGFAFDPGKSARALDRPPSHAVIWKKQAVTLVKGALSGASDLEVPAKHRGFDLALAGEALVMLATTPVGKTTGLVWREGKSPEIAPLNAPGTCKLIPAFDGHAIARCFFSVMDEETYEERSSATFHRLEGTKWVPVYRGAPVSNATGSVTRNSELITFTRARLEILKCPLEGKCAPLALEAPAAEVRKTLPPGYVEIATDAFDRDAVKPWRALRIETGSSGSDSGEDFVAARADDDIWVLTRWKGFTTVLHSTARKEPHATLVTRVDARVMALNDREPAPWTGACDQLFVRLPGRAGSEHLKRADEIKKALVVGKSDEDYYEGPPITWSLVEGTLSGAPTTGVVIMRADVSASTKAMEQAAEKLAEKFATGPATKPSIFCTLPVLEKRLLNGP